MLMAMATLTWRLLGAKIFKSHRLNQFHWENFSSAVEFSRNPLDVAGLHGFRRG